jgi:anti-sigma B factor antagonist
MATPIFSVDVSTRDGAVVASIGGEIDMATGPAVWAAIASAMEAAEPGTQLVLDLAETTFMDSTGLGLIIRASGVYGTDAVAVRSPQPRILSLFDLTGMRKHIRVIEVGTGIEDVEAT